ncbi:MAG: UDP-N-acetylmuramoyl-tripeptide--D-alanyl-D-alanine ligase [Defluviitaleaceae bacterium]|nr:UDP-N-acetylmuramoyl-tripeptide--D-alanyl-D-alanine ligase [Defluviitaleaceae bacterium]
MNLSIQEIILACDGKISREFCEKKISGVSIDSRKISAGELFIPIAGENFDGHDFISQAAKNGAICSLTERKSAPTDMDIPLIYVNSTRRALMQIAAFYRKIHDGLKVVAVTGSAGKTTTKEMLAAILSQKYKTKHTIGNFNNDIGLPLSIFRLERDDEILVLEMGMSRAGEIRELSLIGAPDIAIITHIGDAHIENFENREGILRAKLEITDGLRNGTVILNGDDPLLTSEIAAKKISRYKKIFVCEKNIFSSQEKNFCETNAIFILRDEEIKITLKIPGAHMLKNALLACAAALELGVSPAQISAAFENFSPPDGRLRVFEKHEMTVIDDVYNANPASMREAIKILCRAKGRRVAILGDIFELGKLAETRHREIGAFAAQEGVDFLVTIGKFSRHMHDAFAENAENSARENLHFDSLDEFEIFAHVKKGDTILLKASRGMKFEKILHALNEK